MCIFTDELHSCSYAQTVNSDRILEMLFCIRSFTSLLQFGSLNASAGGERLRREGETGDIILLNESLRFIQNVASSSSSSSSSFLFVTYTTIQRLYNQQ